MRVLRFVALALAMIVYASTAKASVIVSDTALLNTYFNANSQVVGQSVTTPVGGPWNAITFNYYDTVIDTFGVATGLGPELAYGTLYVLTQTYAGTAAGLSGSTPGFLASTSNIVAGEWVFNPAVLLQGNTQYYFFTDSVATASVAANIGGFYAGGTAIRALPAGNYGAEPLLDAIFTLQGVQAVPEPASFLLVGIGLLAAGGRRLRKRSVRR